MKARWWDGCDRAVEAVTRKKTPGAKHGIVSVYRLSCGHEQVGQGGHPEAVICRECVRLNQRTKGSDR